MHTAHCIVHHILNTSWHNSLLSLNDADKSFTHTHTSIHGLFQFFSIHFVSTHIHRREKKWTFCKNFLFPKRTLSLEKTFTALYYIINGFDTFFLLPTVIECEDEENAYLYVWSTKMDMLFPHSQPHCFQLTLQYWKIECMLKTHLHVPISWVLSSNIFDVKFNESLENETQYHNLIIIKVSQLKIELKLMPLTHLSAL